MKKLISFLFVLMLALTFVVACDDEENSAAEGAVAYDFFRDYMGFSNSLYDEYVYSKSPYNGIKSKSVKVERKTADGTTYEKREYEYDSNTRLLTRKYQTSSDDVSYVDGEQLTRTYNGSSYTYELVANDSYNRKESGTGTLNSNNQIVSYSGTETYAYAGQSYSKAVSGSYTFSGWDLTESVYKYDTSEYKSTYQFDGSLPKNTMFYIDGTLDSKTEYYAEGGKITTVKEFDENNTVTDEYTVEYDGDGNIKLIESTTEKYEVTWSNGLPKTVKESSRTGSGASWEEDYTQTFSFSSGRVAERVYDYPSGNKSTYTYTYSE